MLEMKRSLLEPYIYVCRIYVKLYQRYTYSLILVVLCAAKATLLNRRVQDNVLEIINAALGRTRFV